MRMFGLLAMVIVLAIVMYQYKSSIQTNTASSEKGEPSNISKSVEEDVNKSVSGFQKQLDDALKKSGD